MPTAGADANRDGSVNMGDVVRIDMLVLGIVAAIPIDPLTPVQKLGSIRVQIYIL
jgi:hypothetical protein